MKCALCHREGERGWRVIQEFVTDDERLACSNRKACLKRMMKLAAGDGIERSHLISGREIIVVKPMLHFPLTSDGDVTETHLGLSITLSDGLKVKVTTKPEGRGDVEWEVEVDPERVP